MEDYPAPMDTASLPQRAEECPEKVTRVTRFYFVRHGRSTHNESEEDRPLIWDAPLHKIGTRQASLLRETLQHVPFDTVITSPLTRAIQTALISIGHIARIGPGLEVWHGGRRSVVQHVSPTVLIDETGIRFDASQDEFVPLEASYAGPGAKVRLSKDVDLCHSGTQGAGCTCTVTGAKITLRGSEDLLSSLDILPVDAPRCPISAWPEATEQLHESDDLGSSALDLRQRFPCVNFDRLPQDGSSWWWSDAELPDSFDAFLARRCWEQHGNKGPLSYSHSYDEPEEHFSGRITKLIEGLENLAESTKHVALFAHCWVLEEIWRQRFQKPRRFKNAEIAIVDVLEGGHWEEFRTIESSDSED